GSAGFGEPFRVGYGLPLGPSSDSAAARGSKDFPDFLSGAGRPKAAEIASSHSRAKSRRVFPLTSMDAPNIRSACNVGYRSIKRNDSSNARSSAYDASRLGEPSRRG